MQPIRASAPREEWRTKPTVDLTRDDMVIKPPIDYPTFTSPVRGAFTSVNAGTQKNPYDFTGNAAINRNPPVYSLSPGGAMPGMTHYAGEYLDPAKTTESLKALLEGINDAPASKKSKKKKKKQPTKEDAELAEMMAGAGLSEKQDGETLTNDTVKEVPIEQEEENEEEDDDDDEMNRVEGLNVTLLPHQVRGLAFLQSREEKKGRSGILADDVHNSPLLSISAAMLMILIDGIR